MRVFFSIVLIIGLFSCQQTVKKTGDTVQQESQHTGSFGQSPDTQEAVPASQLSGLFSDTDTIDVTLSGDISASCRHSGCWMDLDMGNNAMIHVTFEDEAFTIPLDAAGKKAIAQGKALRKMIPVETLQNYAREDGKSEEEIASITEPAWIYEMIASGVLIEE